MERTKEPLSDADFWRAVYQAQAIELASKGCGPDYVSKRAREVANAALADYVTAAQEVSNG